MSTASSLPVPRKSLIIADLTDDEIEELAKQLGKRFKYTKAFTIVAKNPAILTHQLANLVPVNNVPDTFANLNRKLMNMGFVVACSDPIGKPKAGNSHHWFTYEMPKGIIDTRSACNDGGSE